MLLRGRSDDSIGFRHTTTTTRPGRRASVIHNFSLNLEIPPRFFILPSSLFYLLFFFFTCIRTCLHIIEPYSRETPPCFLPFAQIISFNPPPPSPLTSESFSIQLERQPHAFPIEKSSFFLLLLFSFLSFFSP